MALVVTADHGIGSGERSPMTIKNLLTRNLKFALNHVNVTLIVFSERFWCLYCAGWESYSSIRIRLSNIPPNMKLARTKPYDHTKISHLGNLTFARECNSIRPTLAIVTWFLETEICAMPSKFICIFFSCDFFPYSFCNVKTIEFRS